MFSYALLFLLFPTVMAFAATSDLLTMTISNRLSAVLAGGFFVAAFLIGMSLTEIGWHFLAGLAVLVVAFTCFSFGWIVGGDAKLAAATALWLGFSHLMDYLLIASFFGGALTLFILWVRQWPLPEVLGRQEWISRLHAMHSGIPYGIALALAALIVYPDTAFIHALTIVR
jgi:prepilin peptidase CpaA